MAIGRENSAVPRRPRRRRSSNEPRLRLRFELSKDLTAVEATTEILRRLLDHLVASETGTIADLDDDYLHDFRVAIRRTRSALSQLKGVFSRDATALYRRELKWVGAVTGPARDLDVLHQKLPSYLANLPADVAATFSPVNRWLAGELTFNHSRITSELGSDRFARFKSEWSGFLRSGYRNALGRSSGVPVIDLSNKRISAAHHCVITRGEGVVERSSSAEAWHGLRIDCKKLRYLLEFFRGLHPEGSIAPLIADLKSLQNHLGDSNDFEVQKNWLRALNEKIEGGVYSWGFESAPAIRLLIEFLERRQEEKKARFRETFAGFSLPARQSAFRTLFEN